MIIKNKRQSGSFTYKKSDSKHLLGMTTLSTKLVMTRRIQNVPIERNCADSLKILKIYDIRKQKYSISHAANNGNVAQHRMKKAYCFRDAFRFGDIVSKGQIKNGRRISRFF